MMPDAINVASEITKIALDTKNLRPTLIKTESNLYKLGPTLIELCRM